MESHIIPSEDHISPNLVELKGIPEFSNLVVGHNGCGEFSLWYVLGQLEVSHKVQLSFSFHFSISFLL